MNTPLYANKKFQEKFTHNDANAVKAAITELDGNISNINSLNLWIPKNAVATKAALVTTYTAPAKNWAAMVLADGYVYINDGLGALEANWVNSGQKVFPVDVATKSDTIAPILTQLTDSATVPLDSTGVFGDACKVTLTGTIWVKNTSTWKNTGEKLFESEKATKTDLSNAILPISEVGYDVTRSTNLLNPSNPHLNESIYSNGTTYSANTTLDTSDFCTVEESTTYYFNSRVLGTLGFGFRKTAFYDINKALLRYDDFLQASFVTPANCAFIKGSFYNGTSTTRLLTVIDISLTKSQGIPFELYYPPFNAPKLLKRTGLSPESIVAKRDVDSISASLAETQLMVNELDGNVGLLESIQFDTKETTNLIDSTKFTQGFIIVSNGTKVAFANYQYSDFTPVVAGQIYTGLVNDALGTIFRYVCFYNSNKVVIAGGSDVTISQFTAPTGAAFVKVSTFSVVYGRLSKNVGLFVGATAIWEEYYTLKSFPKLRDGSGNSSNSIVMKSDVAGLTNVKQITISNSDKIIFFADSYTEQIHTLKGKSYLSYLSMFSDWNFENYSQGGNDYATILNRIKSDAATYHPDFGISKYNGNYAFLMSYTNDRNTNVITVANQLNLYLDNLKKVITAVKGLGLIPVICTEYHNVSTTPGVSDLLQSSLSDIANEYGCIFADILAKTKFLKPAINYPQFWSTSHPGIRANTIFWDNLKPYIDSLPRPRQAIKIFRKRSSFVIATTADLLYQDNLSRAKAFKELNVSQRALLDTDAKYFDDLTAWTALDHSSQIVCEYLDLRKGAAIAFSDYGLVEIIAPATAKNINTFNLILSDATVSVYVKDLVNNVWVVVTNDAGVISLPKFMGYFDVDKVSFLLYKAGGFSLTNCYAEWSGIESKDVFSGTKKITKEISTIELLQNTKVDLLTNWTITGTLAPATPFDSALPVEITKMVELTTSNYLSQHVTFIADTLRKRKLQVKLWVRFLPPVFLSTDVYPANSWTNEDKYDLGEILIQIKKDENNVVTKKHYVGLSWHEILFEIDVPINETGFDLLLKSNDTKIVQFCFASVKIEN